MALLIFHVLPSLISGLLFFILISVIVFAFRIQHPTLRAFLYILVLYKAVEAMFLKNYIIKPYYGFTFRIVDPFNSIPNSYDFYSPLFSGGPIYNQIVAFLFLLAFIFIIYRWFKLWRFYANLSENNFISYKDCPKIFNIIEKYTNIFHVKQPRVALSLSNYSLPAIVGFFKPIIVISPKMVDSLSEENLEIIISHELAHIKRKDNFFQWLALAFRDLAFFNPLSYYLFNRYLLFKELAADNLVKIKTKITEEQIIACVKQVKIFVKENKLKDLPSASYLSLRKDNINYFNNAQFKLNNIKIAFTIILFASLLLLQFVFVSPLGK